MIAELPGALLGWLLGSGINPIEAVWSHVGFDSKPNAIGREDLIPHANKWEHATKEEALAATQGYISGCLKNGKISSANHASYDSDTHRGGPWYGLDFKNHSTEMSAHWVYNDFILGAVFLPKAMYNSLVTNVNAAINRWDGNTTQTENAPFEEVRYSNDNGYLLGGNGVNNSLNNYSNNTTSNYSLYNGSNSNFNLYYNSAPNYGSFSFSYSW